MLQIRAAALQRLHRDWEARRAGRAFPARRDFDVLDFKYVIGQLSLLDVRHDPLGFRFRLHGTGIAQRVGYDMTGKDMDDLPVASVRDSAHRHFAEVVEQRVPLVEFRERQVVDDRIIGSEILVLPLSGDGARIDMLMVGVAFI
ncbi:MAG TPA: PAS domain-containing protein [Stellaceae bacterium]|nr:PAS domain-containing protein [Stellaceae bacterium]